MAFYLLSISSNVAIIVIVFAFVTCAWRRTTSILSFFCSIITLSQNALQVFVIFISFNWRIADNILTLFNCLYLLTTVLLLFLLLLFFFFVLGLVLTCWLKVIYKCQFFVCIVSIYRCLSRCTRSRQHIPAFASRMRWIFVGIFHLIS